jgi:hypothetical protein
MTKAPPPPAQRKGTLRAIDYRRVRAFGDLSLPWSPRKVVAYGTTSLLDVA